MRKSRMALAVVGAFSLVLAVTLTGAVPAFAHTADSTHASEEIERWDGLQGPLSAAYAPALNDINS